MSILTMRRGVTVTIAGAALMICLAGCGADEPATRSSTSAASQDMPGGRRQASPAPTNTDPQGRRTDIQPLTTRFPALGTPEKAAWVSGTMGSDRAPGATTYWIDAVITLTPEQADQLIASAGSLAPVTLTTSEQIRADLSAGELSGSAQLNQALSTAMHPVQAGFGADHRTLVMKSLFQ
jgi:hypothetical protein